MNNDPLPIDIVPVNTADAARIYQKRLRALSVRLADVREVERRKLSKDLHDLVGHELGLARIKLSGIVRSGDHEISEELEKSLLDVEEHLKQAIRQSRSLGYEYYPQVLDDAGLIPALEWLSSSYADRQDLCIRLELDPSFEQLRFSENLRSRLFTAVRECVYNAWKYADPEKIIISVTPKPDEQVEISIEDNGRGFDVGSLDHLDRKEGGFGLFSIREMIEHQGGEFSCTSSPGEGTRITLLIPPEHVDYEEQK
ncbi:ATP-binding protein [Kiritimatiellaeota bacterium B1221]|nr:ATP-binding protein [Kiritimatiellaeota bacterium B1221]